MRSGRVGEASTDSPCVRLVLRSRLVRLEWILNSGNPSRHPVPERRRRGRQNDPEQTAAGGTLPGSGTDRETHVRRPAQEQRAVRQRCGCGRDCSVAASIGCSLFPGGFLFQNHYPRFRGAPSAFFKGCPQGRPSVDSGLRSQYPMLALMVGYTMMSLWILAQPIVAET